MANDLLEKEQNPSQRNWNETLNRDEKSAGQSNFDDIANNFYKNTADPSQENRNIAAAAEKNLSSGSQSAKGKREATSNTAPKSRRDKALTFVKKITPFTALLGIFLVGLAGILIINIPALVLVQIKEGAMEDLFDSLPVAELRTLHVFRAKVKKPTTAKICVKGAARCTTKTFSQKQLNKLRKAGFKTTPADPKKIGSGRYKVDSIDYTDKSGKTRRISPRDMNRQYRINPEFRSRMNKAYNPKWNMLRDSRAGKVLNRFNVKLNRIIGGSKKAMSVKSREFVRNGIGNESTTTRLNQGRGRPNLPDDASRQNYVNETTKARKELSRLSSKSQGLKGMLKGGARAGNIFTGFQAQTCAVIKSIEVAGTAARIIKYAELLRLAILIYNIADSIPYGEATYESVDFAGKFVTSVDLSDKVIAEDSFGDGDNIVSAIMNRKPDESPKMVDNPDKGKSPTESVGQKASLYGSVGNLSMRDSQFVMGAGFQGTLKSITDWLRKNSKGALEKDNCDFYENKLVQTGGLILSLFAGAGVGSAIKAGGQMALFMFITSYINGVISDLLSGESASVNLVGVDAGNALFAGGGAFFGAMAGSRGLTPVSTSREVRNMQSMRNESLQQQAKVARYEARSEPFNIYNQYSFLGSIVWSLDPALVQSLSRTGVVLRTPGIIFGSLASLLSPKTRAAVSEEARYGKCQDPTFVGGGIRNAGSNESPNIVENDGVGLNKADLMCNIRYNIDPMHSNADPERVIDWMVDSGQAASQTGEAINDKATMEGLLEAERNDAKVDKASPRDGAPIQEGDVKLPSNEMNEQQIEDFLDNTKGQDLPTSYNSSESIIHQSITDVLRPDDDTLADLGIPLNTPSDKLVTYTPGYQAAKLAASEEDLIKNNQTNSRNAKFLPPPIGPYANTVKEEGYDPVKDVRTYAHWLRFCRYGDDEGRQVQIGDGDELDGKVGFTKLVFSGIATHEYISDGRECLKSNTCSPDQDPNGASWSQDPGNWGGEEAMRKRCRPPQYDIYSVYFMDRSVEEGLDQDDNEEDSDLADGDTRELARKLADHEHMSWQNGQVTPNLLREFADTGKAVNFCGQEFAPDKLMLQVMLKQLDTYTIVGNNIGFKGDRFLDCDDGMHPKGKAIDINQISAREGPNKGKSTGATITFGSSEEVSLITEFAIDWIDAAGKEDKRAGRSGQIGCGGYNLLNKRKPEWEGADGNLHFDDDCNHLHIDVGQR